MNNTKNGKDNNKTTLQNHLGTIGFWAMIIGELLAIAVGICFIVSVVMSLVRRAPLAEVFLENLRKAAVEFGSWLLPILWVIAFIVIICVAVVLMDVIKTHPVVFLVIILVIAIAVPVGSSTYRKYTSDNTNDYDRTDETRSTDEHKRWDYFEQRSRIGDDYGSISRDYHPFSEENVMNGGIYLKADNGFYYAFPKYTREDVVDSDLCTAMLGVSEDMFGYTNSVAVSDFVFDLGLTSNSVIDGNLSYKKTSNEGYYYVVIMDTNVEDTSDLITPNTCIAVIQRNRETIQVGNLALDQPAEESTVFYVNDGTCYHSDPSCSTLHDSDEIYECYRSDVPEGRRACDVCY